jgi:serine/threonine-protein kinase
MVADGDDGRPRPVLLDFGIAKLLDPDTATGEDTATGVRPMTRTYAAPEQVRGEPATTATDVYALGLLLYHLLAGERLFADADAPAALDHAVLHTEAPPPSARAADPRAVRGDPDTICLAALRKEPAERYASAEALAADIDRYLTGIPIAARAPTVGYRVRRFVQRHRLGVATAAAFVLLLAGASVVTTLQSVRLAETAREATLARDRAEAVSDFLTGLFEASDPSVEAGDVSVREVLDRGAERLGEDLADQPEVRSDLLRVVGKVYVSLGLYEPAEARLREAVATARAAGAEEVHADALLNLGNLLYRLERIDEALAALEEARRRTVQIHGDDDPAVATVLNSLGLVYQSGGDTTRALETLERVVAIRRLDPGDEPGRTLAINLNNLADLLVETGDLARAEGLYDEALGLVRDDVGPEHPYVAFLLNSRAGLHQARRDLAGARADQAEAVRIGLAAFGEDHPFTAVALHNLGAIERDAGRRDAARQAFARALAIRERTLPPDNPDVLESREALASVR